MKVNIHAACSINLRPGSTLLNELNNAKSTNLIQLSGAKTRLLSPKFSLSRHRLACFQDVTLFDEPHFARRALLPQAEAVAALGASDGGVLRGDSALAPGHPIHLPLLLLVREGALPLLALRCCGGGDRTPVVSREGGGEKGIRQSGDKRGERRRMGMSLHYSLRG